MRLAKSDQETKGVARTWSAIVSRREFVVGTGLAALAFGCNKKAAPDESPIYRGPFAVRRAILGVTPSTEGMPLPQGIQAGFISGTSICNDPNNEIDFIAPARVRVMVYYPAISSSSSTSVPIQVATAGNPKFPVVLYAHARRLPVCPTAFPSVADPSLFNVFEDYTRVGDMLDHLASHGCVVFAPDLSWLTGISDSADWTSIASGRARVLVTLYQYVQSLNAGTFSGRLNLSTLMLAGHSSGGGACLVAAGHFSDVGGPKPVALGLVAPASGTTIAGLAANAPPLIALEGTVDWGTGNHANPREIYLAASSPKALVTITGANHFGYTEICSPDNTVCAAYDNPGTIPRIGQQLTGAGYLAALMRRFALGDTTVNPYLTGQRLLEVDTFGVTGLQVTQQGM